MLALSDDGTRLWVGTDGDFAIRKVELGAGAPVLGAQYKLPFGANYPYQTMVGSMKPLHGSADSVIVVLASSTESVGVVVIDNGVPRAAATRSFASCVVPGRGDTVFGANGRITSYEFYTMQLSSTGLAQTTFDRLLTNFTRDLVFAHDRVYSEGGEVVDVTTPGAPVNLGKLPTWGWPRPLPNDPTRVLLLLGGPRDGYAVLRTVDTATRATKAMVSITGATGYYMRDLDLLGTDSIAFIAEETTPDATHPNLLIVARTSLLP